METPDWAIHTGLLKSTNPTAVSAAGLEDEGLVDHDLTTLWLRKSKALDDVRDALTDATADAVFDRLRFGDATGASDGEVDHDLSRGGLIDLELSFVTALNSGLIPLQGIGH